MLRKTILGAATALTLGLTAMAPTAASAHGGGISVHFGGGGFGFGGHHYHNHYWGGCYKKKVKVFNPYLGHYVWTKKKICY